MRLNKKFIITILGVAVLATFANFPASAQLITQPQGFFIELRPLGLTGPNRALTARLSGFSFDIDSARITWIHNGRVQTQGLGLREYRFTTGDLGGRETIRALAVDRNGINYEAEVSFVVSSVSLLWRAQTSVPYWYKGLALPSERATVVVSAFPEVFEGGRRVSSQNLIFRWTLDDDFKQNQSGAGKNTFSLRTNFASGVAHEVGLEVLNISGETAANGSVLIPVLRPEVAIYEHNALSGPVKEFSFSGERDDIVFAGESKTYIAEPFFFSTNGEANLEYVWGVNGRRAEASEPNNLLFLETDPDAGGRASIEVLVNNIANILQSARQSFSVDIF